MKILITGSTRFVGQNLLEYYKDYNCYAYKRGVNLYVTLHK